MTFPPKSGPLRKRVFLRRLGEGGSIKLPFGIGQGSLQFLPTTLILFLSGFVPEHGFLVVM